tara:strand:- start:338 stop:568 length:231 start_codon:yes stop_codon:yes gene_type:complete
MPTKESMQYADDAGGDELIGARVKVYWAGDKKWYQGEVDQYDAASNRHHVGYDDGDEKWHCLAHEGEVRARLPACR